MPAQNGSPALPARILWGGSWGFLCALTVAAPLLLASGCAAAGSAIYVLFSGFCHQIPERSFFAWGFPLAICHRCFGFYLGFFLGSYGGLGLVPRSPRTLRIYVISASLPMLLDALLPFTGFWQSTGFSRFSSGLLLGCLISPLAVRGIAQWLEIARGRSLPSATCPYREAFHE